MIFFKLKMMFTSKGLKSSSCWKDSKLKLNKTHFELWVVQLSYTSVLKCTKHCPNKQKNRQNEVRKPVSQMNISFTALHFH